MLDESKSLRQEQGISIWKTNQCNGTLNYIMRFGKTRIIELVVKRTLDVNSSKKIILLVPTDIAYQNVKYIVEGYKIECHTINTMINLLKNKTDLSCYILIIDEIHKFTNDKTINFLKKIKSQFKLGLTGSTLTKDQKKVLKQIGFPVIDTIYEEEAIEKQWISDYEEYNVAVDISENDKIHYKLLSDAITNISDNFKGLYIKVNKLFMKHHFGGDFDLIQSLYTGKKILDYNFKQVGYIKPDELRTIVCHMQGFRRDAIISNDYTERIQTFWNPNNIEELAKSYIKCVGTRNAYLKHNVSKVNAVLELSQIIDKSTIIYNDSIDMIDQLYNTIKRPSVKYHSAIEPVVKYYDNGQPICYLSGERAGEVKMFGAATQKRDAIEAMISGEALYLITGRSLNESLNIPNVEFIICTSGDTNSSTYEQRTARGKTIDNNNANKKATVINLFINDYNLNDTFVVSRDKQKLITRQTNVKNVIWVENISDMICIIKNNTLLLQHE